MITYIPNFLSAEEVAPIAAQLAQAGFTDGAVTAGWHAREVKKNQQLIHGMPGHEPLEKAVRAVLLRNPTFQMAARPRYIAPIIFNRYETGMNYGRHVDEPLMNIAGASPSHLRSDISFTLFLTDPAAYEGGELIIGGGGVEQSFKQPVGTLIAYPSSTIHRVMPVTSGVRFAAIGWVQSEIRDSEQRAIIYDLDRVRRGIYGKEGKTDAFDLLTKCHANLLRMWAEL